MTVVTKTIVVPYKPEQMLELVSDVKSYPNFIPWIRSLRVASEKERDETWTGRASAAVGFKGFSESFTTDVTADKKRSFVAVKLVKGPFKYLENSWVFKAHKDGCEVCFKINFEFSNFLLHALMKANFDKAVSKLISVFIEEAERRYLSV